MRPLFFRFLIEKIQLNYRDELAEQNGEKISPAYSCETLA